MGDIWTCKIGSSHNVPQGGDYPMRRAIAKAYRELTGDEPNFIFSGWGGQLTESETAVVGDRSPDPNVIIGEYRKQIDDALDAINAAMRHIDASTETHEEQRR